MNIVYVYADHESEWNCSEWRCAVPARAINRTSRHHAKLLSIDDFRLNTPLAVEICQAADIIVVQRNLFELVLSAMQHWKARDKAIIVDFDDAYQLLPVNHPNYSFWNQGIIRLPNLPIQKIDPPPLTQFKWGLKLAHAATVPSKRLADDWQSYTEIHYLPNYIDLKLYENAIKEKHTGVIIGWGGSVSHLQSFTNSGVVAALKKVCTARPQVTVMICGNDRRIFDLLQIPNRQKILHPWVNYKEWPSILANFDIGLAPLSGEYDERRSWIKVLEYMVMKIPWVASDGNAYQEMKHFGWLVKNNPEAWERILIDMVDHISDYKNEAAGEPYLFGISQNIDENINRVITLYEKIYQKAIGNTQLIQKAEMI
ncbi:MAG: glycosyltransferase family 4 protein [Chloroflexi bacterium]|nr:glycosyltransferase family 4 protein [Chloroflexota bacterium]